MLYWLAEWIKSLGDVPGINLFSYVTFRAAAAAITALLISLLGWTTHHRATQEDADRRAGQEGAARGWQALAEGGDADDGRTHRSLSRPHPVDPLGQRPQRLSRDGSCCHLACWASLDSSTITSRS